MMMGQRAWMGWMREGGGGASEVADKPENDCTNTHERAIARRANTQEHNEARGRERNGTSTQTHEKNRQKRPAE